MKKWYVITVSLLLLLSILGITIGCSPSVSEPRLPAPPQPAYATEDGAINAVILHLADLTELTGDDYAFACNQFKDIYDWGAYLTQDIWSVSASLYVQGLGKQHAGTWQIDSHGNVTPSDAKAQQVEDDFKLLQKDSESSLGTTPTPSPWLTEYHELPSFDYVGITPPMGEPHRLYDTLLRIRWDTNWSSLYKMNEFDCSEMSGLLEDYLEDNGFDTYILCAEVTERDWAWALEMELQKVLGLRKGGKAYHAWVAVRIDGEYMAVESTIPCDTKYYGAYKYQYIYTSVDEAERDCLTEFDYWNSPQYSILKSYLEGQIPPAPQPTPTPTNLTASVEILAGKFYPARLEVKVGTTVTWTNKSMVGYRLEGDGGINSPTLDKYDTFPLTFNQAGTFHYWARYRSTALGGEGDIAITGGQVIVVP